MSLFVQARKNFIDSDGRFGSEKMCTANEYKAVGTLGIVIKAHQQKIINLQEAEDYLLQLYDVSSLYVTRAIVDLAIQQLRQYSEHS